MEHEKHDDTHRSRQRHVRLLSAKVRGSDVCNSATTAPPHLPSSRAISSVCTCAAMAIGLTAPSGSRSESVDPLQREKKREQDRASGAGEHHANHLWRHTAYRGSQRSHPTTVRVSSFESIDVRGRCYGERGARELSDAFCVPGLSSTATVSASCRVPYC